MFQYNLKKWFSQWNALALSKELPLFWDSRFTDSVFKGPDLGVPVTVLGYVFLYCNFLTEVKETVNTYPEY